MKHIMVVLVLLAVPEITRAQWVKQWDQVDNRTPYAIFFIDSSIGWAAGYSADNKQSLILHTLDQGNVWTMQGSGTTNSIRSITFIDTNNGWACGDAATIIHTTDGGNDWMTQTNPLIGSGTSFFGIAFVNSNDGWVVSSGGKILHTTNTGNVWEEQQSGTNIDLLGVSFTDTNNGWVIGTSAGADPNINSIILHTINGGKLWYEEFEMDHSSLNALTFRDTKNGWAVGGSFYSSDGGMTLLTTDGGNNWESKILDFAAYLYCVSFSDSLNGWAGGNAGCLFHTNDGGLNWIRQQSFMPSTVTGIFFADTNSGWGVGGNGIFHIGGPKSRVSNSPLTNTEKILFFQNHPNPFFSSTTFDYTLPRTSFVTIRIMNALGQGISNLVSEVEGEGIHEVKWDTHNIPNGIYFCQVKVGEYSQTIQVIVAK